MPPYMLWCWMFMRRSAYSQVPTDLLVAKLLYELPQYALGRLARRGLLSHEVPLLPDPRQ